MPLKLNIEGDRQSGKTTLAAISLLQNMAIRHQEGNRYYVITNQTGVPAMGYQSWLRMFAFNIPYSAIDTAVLKERVTECLDVIVIPEELQTEATAPQGVNPQELYLMLIDFIDRYQRGRFIIKAGDSVMIDLGLEPRYNEMLKDKLSLWFNQQGINCTVVTITE